MKYSQALPGRIFVLRLEDGDVVHETIETMAREQSIHAAALVILGGADAGSRLVVGPEDGRASPVTPLETLLDNVHEVTGTGTLFANEAGEPVLHLHLACGRKRGTITGCVRRGVRVWQVMEAVLFELTETRATRRFEPETGFSLLQP